MSREIEIDRKKRRYYALLWLFGIVVALMLAATLSIVVYNTVRLVDCVDPGGHCNKQGRDSQSGAVGTINKITVTAVYCAKLPGNDTLVKIQSCVQANLK